MLLAAKGAFARWGLGACVRERQRGRGGLQPDLCGGAAVETHLRPSHLHREPYGDDASDVTG